MLTKIGFNGEVLRKREIIYMISGDDPRKLGFEIIKDHSEELALRKDGIVYAVGETGLSMGGFSISRRLGGYQQKDLVSSVEALGGGVFLMGDRSPKTKEKRKPKKKSKKK